MSSHALLCNNKIVFLSNLTREEHGVCQTIQSVDSQLIVKIIGISKCKEILHLCKVIYHFVKTECGKRCIFDTNNIDMKIKLFLVAFAAALFMAACDAPKVDLSEVTIVYDASDDPLTALMAETLAGDIEMVSGVRPAVSTEPADGPVVVLGTAGGSSIVECPEDIAGKWETYSINTEKGRVEVVGSDPRGLAYGVFRISEAVGVNPWYWWSDVPVKADKSPMYGEDFVSDEPSIKYRGVFINDEDWGMKTWSERNFEKELGDIGPKTYDKVCELMLRLKANMLAPAMHTCTGAFYSHPESQVMADKWGIMITTSHCEPLLINNAAPTEWDTAVDGEWNYLTNGDRIVKKFDDRIRETARYDNIYTTGMRGLHDEAMKGSEDPSVRARTLEKVFEVQRQILEKYKGMPADQIRQIFVPYKETLDIYDAGLVVPEDITLVWTDDNYGYMKRVPNQQERRRSGGNGVYYHLSYLGTPHDYLWMNTTAPMLMYEELKKAYDAGADRYWLLNVGDIKPMELGIQMFMDMAWDIDEFSYENANTYQAEWLSSLFGNKHKDSFQTILDEYYRLAWDRKPEYMGYEREWDPIPSNNELMDSDYSFEDGSAQERLASYKTISDKCEDIMRALPEDQATALFEMLGYSVKSAYQMNLKFLMAQRNHETGSREYADAAVAANDSIQTLIDEFHAIEDGKWNQMISEVPPGFCAKYQMMPELVSEPTDRFKLPDFLTYTEFPNKIDIFSSEAKTPFRILEGMGTEWKVLQLGEPLDDARNPCNASSDRIDISFTPDALPEGSTEITLCISTVPMWPVYEGRSNSFGVSLDGCAPVICENIVKEWDEPWKMQVSENRKEYVVTFPIDVSVREHTLSFHIGDPGQLIQKVTYR